MSCLVGQKSLMQGECLESFVKFLERRGETNPLWKNTQFFIKLPFKLNKDVNPTKAIHPGMSSTDLKLDYTDILFQDSQDPWEEFMSLLSFPKVLFQIKETLPVLQKERSVLFQKPKK